MAISEAQALAALRAQLDAARAENDKLQADKAKLQAKVDKRNVLRLKVSEKGGMSIYGMGRFPVTLYKGQWRRVLTDEFIAEMREFLDVHDDELTSKED
jgi:multidrug resistance efflux pump